MSRNHSRLNQMGEYLIDGVGFVGDVAGIGLGIAGKAVGKSMGAVRFGIYKALEYPENK